MTLSDREILELNDLCNSIVDGIATEAQQVRLSNWIMESEDARQYYIRAMDLSASLGSYASEMQMEAPDLQVEPSSYMKRGAAWLWLALAASIFLTSTLWIGSPSVEMQSIEAEHVARITGEKSSVWSGGSVKTRLGDLLVSGERIELTQGFAEVTFDSGAVVAVEGPATLDVNSPWSATLLRGVVRASVPSQAIGFRISNPAVEVVDLGTAFSMAADGQGVASVFVIEGEVEAVSRGSSDIEAILLGTNESRSFAVPGNSTLESGLPIKPHSNMPDSFDGYAKPANYVLWSLDEAEGRVLRSKVVGFPGGTYDLTLKRRRSQAGHVEGFRNNGIQFDGKLFAKASFPGLSTNIPRTFAFWVKVSKDAALSDAYAMAAWRADSVKLGARPVHIGWNRNPEEGLIGALRTDFSGGHAMGKTSLRDGLWHYISVVFQPGIDPDSPVQVKQYVDGKLESNRVNPGPKLSTAARGPENGNPNLADTIWLGCRLGSSGPKKARFRGAIDEFVITDRGLTPVEITRLMDGQEITPPNLLEYRHGAVTPVR